MTDILIRDVPEEIAAALSQKAEAAGKDRMAYIRDELTRIASEPIVKERYALRFSTDTGLAQGMLRRFHDEVEPVGVYGLTRAVEPVIDQVKALMKRNQPGDREEAIYLLRCHFNNVFEVPV